MHAPLLTSSVQRPGEALGPWRLLERHPWTYQEQLIPGAGWKCCHFLLSCSHSSSLRCWQAGSGAMPASILPSGGSSRGKPHRGVMDTQLPGRTKTRMDEFGCGNCKVALGSLAAARSNPNPAETVICPAAAPGCSLYARGGISKEDKAADHEVSVGCCS